jgi:phage baseplate assembly protein W
MPVQMPHIAFPFEVRNGRTQVVEQNSIQEVTQCVLTCLSTPYGSRQDDPEYGIDAGLFSKQSIRQDISPILAAVEEAEPRASLLGEVKLESLIRRIVIEVEGVAVSG